MTIAQPTVAATAKLRTAATGDTAVTPHPLRLVSSKLPVDVEAAADAVRALLLALGEDPDTENLRRTPHRVAAAYAEMFATDDFELTTFANEEGYDELVLARDIPFSSLCEHHMLPFYGVAHVGYLPNERIVGLSKLARMVEWCASGLQVQERLTQQIVTELDASLHAKGVGVVVEATHQCMTIRGVRAHDARTLTSALRGHLRSDAAARQEFFSLTRR